MSFTTQWEDLRPRLIHCTSGHSRTPPRGSKSKCLSRHANNWLSITIPLVPPRALGDVTQLDVGAPVDVGAVSEVVIGRRLTSLGFHKVRTVCHFGDNILIGDEGTIQCVRKYNRENRGQEIGIYE